MLPQIVHAGINDWGGVSPVTPDFVNPEAPWPHLDELTRETAAAGKLLTERLTVYPAYAVDLEQWTHTDLHERILEMIDSEGFPRIDEWCPGDPDIAPPSSIMNAIINPPRHVSQDIRQAIQQATKGEALSEQQIVRLFSARGDDFSAVVQSADQLRRKTNGDSVSFVVNRNINYTNICYFKCQFCAFSKGKCQKICVADPTTYLMRNSAPHCRSLATRGHRSLYARRYPSRVYRRYLRPYCRSSEASRTRNARACVLTLGGVAGAATRMSASVIFAALATSWPEYPAGTAAEILDDEVRAVICADKINTQQWLDVMRAAHDLGFKTTATIMYGHVEHQCIGRAI